MNIRFTKLAAGFLVGSLLMCNGLLASPPPTSLHYTHYTHPDGSVTVYQNGAEVYVKETLPNEWYGSWSAITLQAGAVIIRSGTFWRINRSVLNSSYPNNNCYRGSSPGLHDWYREAPQTRGGDENFIPFSGMATTNSATDSTANIHADRVTIPSGRPDAFMPHRYNSTIQTRTRDCAGATYHEKIRCAVLDRGRPYDPNEECSQVDDLTTTDPRYATN
jgi:hypothetical protein